MYSQPERMGPTMILMAHPGVVVVLKDLQVMTGNRDVALVPHRDTYWHTAACFGVIPEGGPQKL
eukprot:1347324-Amphidinium_carterae.1